MKSLVALLVSLVSFAAGACFIDCHRNALEGD